MLKVRIANLFFSFVLLLALFGTAPERAAAAPAPAGTYHNPLQVQIPGDGLVESCADPSIIRGQTTGDAYWYIYCTTDPLNDADRDSSGGLNFHLIPTLRSLDLVNWEYVGDVFQARPAWVAARRRIVGAGHPLFQRAVLPVLYRFGYRPAGRRQRDWRGDRSPARPDPGPTAAPPWLNRIRLPAARTSRRWVFDPAILTDDTGQMWIYYGSYFGGISVAQAVSGWAALGPGHPGADDHRQPL